MPEEEQPEGPDPKKHPGPPPPHKPELPPHILHELLKLREKVGRLEGMMEVLMKKRED